MSLVLTHGPHMAGYSWYTGCRISGTRFFSIRACDRGFRIEYCLAMTATRALREAARLEKLEENMTCAHSVPRGMQRTNGRTTHAQAETTLGLLFQKLSAKRTSTFPDCKVMYFRVPGCYRDSLLTAMFGSICRITRFSPLIDS
jgi:hypothetical protein